MLFIRLPLVRRYHVMSTPWTPLFGTLFRVVFLSSRPMARIFFKQKTSSTPRLPNTCIRSLADPRVAQLSVLLAVRSRHGSWRHQETLSAAVWLQGQETAPVEATDHSRDGRQGHQGQHAELVRGVHVLQEGRWRHDAGAAVHRLSALTVRTRVLDGRAILSRVSRAAAATWTHILVERSSASFDGERRDGARHAGDQGARTDHTVMRGSLDKAMKPLNHTELIACLKWCPSFLRKPDRAWALFA